MRNTKNCRVRRNFFLPKLRPENGFPGLPDFDTGKMYKSNKAKKKKDYKRKLCSQEHKIRKNPKANVEKTKLIKTMK